MPYLKRYKAFNSPLFAPPGGGKTGGGVATCYTEFERLYESRHVQLLRFCSALPFAFSLVSIESSVVVVRPQGSDGNAPLHSLSLLAGLLHSRFYTVDAKFFCPFTCLARCEIPGRGISSSSQGRLSSSCKSALRENAPFFRLPRKHKV